MYMVAQVKDIKADGSVQMLCLTSACDSCKAQMFCNNRNDNEYTALNPDMVSIEKGDYVELFMPPGRTVLSTALVFALPLCLFPLGYLLFRAIWPYGNEVLHALGGFAFMALSFVVSSIVMVKNKRRLMPKIVKIVGKSGPVKTQENQ